MSSQAKTEINQSQWALRALILVLLGVGLVWIILTRSLAASLASSDPDTALALQPNEPLALLVLAKKKLTLLLETQDPSVDHARPSFPRQRAMDDTSGDGLATLARLAEKAFASRSPSQAERTDKGPEILIKDKTAGATTRLSRVPPSDLRALRQEIGRLATQAIDIEPWNADALGILGQLAEHDGDPQRTAELMQAAARFSFRESYAVYWLLQQAQSRQNDAAVLRYADTLLRTRGATLSLVVPILAKAVETDQAAADVAGLLATNPPWRSSFFATLPSFITDARTPLYLFQTLAGTLHPATYTEISQYITFLINRGFYELAYYTWLQYQPPEDLSLITPLYNSSFDANPTGFPFDWILREGRGVTSEIRPLPGDAEKKALFVEFTQGRAEFPGVTQLTLLGPGTYELKGALKGTVVGARGLVWQATCAGGARLGQSELLRGDFPQWRSFSFSFTVPASGCRAQQIMLSLDARSQSEKLVTGAMWFDELDLRRLQP